MFFRRKNFQRASGQAIAAEILFTGAQRRKKIGAESAVSSQVCKPATRWPQIQKLLRDRSFELPGLILQVAGVGVPFLAALVADFPPIIGCLLDQRNGITTAGLADNGSFRRWGLADIEV